jgi:hypothetical protein
MKKEIECPHCEDTRREPDYPTEMCHRCRPMPSHLDGFPMGEVSNEFASEWMDEFGDR